MITEDGTGVANANSYVSEAAADAYFTEHPKAATWAALSSSVKIGHLVHATRILDGSVDWKGFRLDQMQSLEWPRYGIELPTPGVYSGLANSLSVKPYWPSDQLPKEVQHAVCELAIANTENGLSSDPTGTEGISSLSVGKGAVALTFDAKTVRTLLGKFVPTLLNRFAFSAGNSPMRRIVRG